MKSSSIKQIIIAILLIGLGGVVGYKLGQGKQVPIVSRLSSQWITHADQPEQYKNVDFRQFWNVWSILEESYLEPEKLNPEDQVNGAIQGMTSSLGDPYTFYLPPTDQQRSEEDLAGAFYGVGIELGYTEGILSVTAPLKGSPAERAGVEAGDLILHLKDSKKKIDEDTTDMSLEDAVNKIRGDKGSPITLTLAREGKQSPFEVVLERDEIVVPSVELSFEERNGKKAAVITLSRFGGRTDQEWGEIVSKIVSEPNVNVVLLDVRNNPGGYLQGAIDIASEFVKDGVVVSQQGRDATEKYTVTRQGKLTNIPVSVLMNKGSASASEIVAGALRDRRNAKLFGENSFGKGTVQDAMELDGGAGLHVTVGRWLLPNGDWIHEKGIAPTVEVKDNPDTEEDEVLIKAIEES